jgi:hypothetical protein
MPGEGRNKSDSVAVALLLWTGLRQHEHHVLIIVCREIFNFRPISAYESDDDPANLCNVPSSESAVRNEHHGSGGNTSEDMPKVFGFDVCQQVPMSR